VSLYCQLSYFLARLLLEFLIKYQYQWPMKRCGSARHSSTIARSNWSTVYTTSCHDRLATVGPDWWRNPHHLKLVCWGSDTRLSEGVMVFRAVWDFAPSCCSVHLLIHVAPSSQGRKPAVNVGGTGALSPLDLAYRDYNVPTDLGNVGGGYR